LPPETTLVGRDLAVEYRSGDYFVRPIDGLDFEAHSGEIVLLLGASGCGKTTLLSVLGAILRPLRGSVRLGPTEVTTLTGDALTEYRRHRVGIVFQSFNLIPSLDASENVQVPLLAAGLRRRAAATRAAALLEQVGLADRARHRPADLSGASSSGSLWPVRSRSTRRSCLQTSRPPISTTSRSRRCSRCCRRSPTAAVSSSSRRTTTG
jgi:ABC-type lipoprotein export system ATPase subunit